MSQLGQKQSQVALEEIVALPAYAERMVSSTMRSNAFYHWSSSSAWMHGAGWSIAVKSSLLDQIQSEYQTWLSADAYGASRFVEKSRSGIAGDALAVKIAEHLEQ
ncbi:MAG: hypothetical protein R3F19_03335 [Verrucomicrobiales bacterium]